MSKSLSVKVSTAKLIKALESALVKREKELSDYEKARDVYDKEYKAFVESLPSLIGTKKLSLKHTNFRERTYNSDGSEVEFSFTLAPTVKPPKMPEGVSYATKHEADEIRNAIAILKMTDDEYVSTNTYKGVAQYL
jgi:hypothetical protein